MGGPEPQKPEAKTDSLVTVFVDTSVWYAVMDRGDSHSPRAKAILNSGNPLLTTDHVLVETWALLRYRGQDAAARRFWDSLRSGIAAVEFVTPADLESAWQIAETYADQNFPIVDCTSFAVMRRLGIERAATFDHHFAVYRFGPERRRAFTILH